MPGQSPDPPLVRGNDNNAEGLRPLHAGGRERAQQPHYVIPAEAGIQSPAEPEAKEAEWDATQETWSSARPEAVLYLWFDASSLSAIPRSTGIRLVVADFTRRGLTLLAAPSLRDELQVNPRSGPLSGSIHGCMRSF